MVKYEEQFFLIARMDFCAILAFPFRPLPTGVFKLDCKNSIPKQINVYIFRKQRAKLLHNDLID